MTQLDQAHPALPAPRADDPLVRLLAWCVHLYTALGLAAAAAIAVLLVRGAPDAFRWSFVLMLVATLVDATDGTLARRVGVKKVLPNFDGRKLDDLTDFLTYTFLPLLLIWRAELLPGAMQVWLLLPLLASAYGFCQVEAKTDDGYFLGFPSLWNVVAFYLYVLQLPGWVALGVVVVLSAADVRAEPLPLPLAARPAQPVQQHPGRSVWAVLLVWILLQCCPSSTSSARRRGSTTRPGPALASLFYPGLLHGRVVGRSRCKRLASLSPLTSRAPSSTSSARRPRAGPPRRRPARAGRPPTTKKTITDRIACAARARQRAARREDERPEDPRELLDDREEAEELPRPVAAGSWLANSDRLSAWLPPWTMPDQDRQQEEVRRLVMNPARTLIPCRPPATAGSTASRRSGRPACRTGTRTGCRRTGPAPGPRSSPLVDPDLAP